MKILSVVIMLLMPCMAFAASNDNAPFWEQIFFAVLPVFLVIAVFYFFLRVVGGKTQNINERIIESNLEIAAQLKRVADHLEKNS